MRGQAFRKKAVFADAQRKEERGAGDMCRVDDVNLVGLVDRWGWMANLLERSISVNKKAPFDFN